MRTRPCDTEFLEFHATTLLDQLRQGSLDCALAAAAESSADSSIECSELLTYPLAFAVRGNGALAKAAPLVDLCDAEWARSDTTDDYPQFVADLFSREDLPVPSRITRCTSQTLMYTYG